MQQQLRHAQLWRERASRELSDAARERRSRDCTRNSELMGLSCVRRVVLPCAGCRLTLSITAFRAL